MANLKIVVNALRKERQLAAKQIEQIDAELAALGNLKSRGRRGKRGHTISAAAVGRSPPPRERDGRN